MISYQSHAKMFSPFPLDVTMTPSMSLGHNSGHQEQKLAFFKGSLGSFRRAGKFKFS